MGLTLHGKKAGERADDIKNQHDYHQKHTKNTPQNPQISTTIL